jgi:hypothetical protein
LPGWLLAIVVIGGAIAIVIDYFIDRRRGD